MRNPNAPLRRDGDTALMQRAIDALEKLGLPLHRPSPYQLKIGTFNFYPDKGTIHRDTYPRLPERGLDALIKLIVAGRS